MGYTRLELLEQLPKGSVAAEIGVWKGGFSEEILETVRPRELHLIDPWLFQPTFGEAIYGGAVAASQADMEAIYDDVVAKYGEHPHVTIHRMTSVEAAELFEPGYLDWVYLDGNHSYEYVKQDLEAFYPKMKPGGLLTGDDYGRKGEWFGDDVARAADEFARDRGLELRTIPSEDFFQFIIQL